jgi:hypothetical protein
MNTTTVTFKVAMDAEQKAAKNFKEVKFECSFDGVSEDTIRRAALQNQIVAWQGQIRANWDKFISGETPKVVTFGNPLFAGKRGGRGPITEADVKAFLSGKTPEQIMAFLKGADDVKLEAVNTSAKPTVELDEDGDPIFQDPGDDTEY